MTSLIVWNDGRAWCHYQNLECFIFGMYKTAIDLTVVQNAVELLSSPVVFEKAAHESFGLMPVTWRVHLTNPHCNRHAFVGRVASLVHCNANVEEVRRAWWILDGDARVAANQVAKKVIESCMKHIEHERYPTRNAQLQFPF